MRSTWIVAVAFPVIMGGVVALVRKTPNVTQAEPRPDAPGHSTAAGGAPEPPSGGAGPLRQRLHKFILIVACLFLGAAALGLSLGLLMLITGEASTGVGMIIFSVVVGGAGALFLIGYRNWYLEVWPDGVRFRRFFGREGFIRYAEIDRFRPWSMQNGDSYTIRDIHGTKLNVNATMYEATALVGQLAHRVQYGFWATPEQLDQAFAAGVLELPTHAAKDLAQPGAGLGVPGRPDLGR